MNIVQTVRIRKRTAWVTFFFMSATTGAFAWGAAPISLYPVRDGTIQDGGMAGPFDGVADDADWYFNDPPGAYEGTITLSTASTHVEHRLVWEYDLASVTFVPPVIARLSFVIRGAAAFPRPDVDVHVYAYPADLLETLDDFSAGPAMFQDHVVVTPYQPSTPVVFDVSEAVTRAVANGDIGVAFRFQIHPATSHAINQAFVDARESDPATKPVLAVFDLLPGDADNNGVSDLGDHGWFAYCLSGPGVAAPLDAECEPLNLNRNDHPNEGDIDLRDYAAFQRYFGAGR